MTASSGLDDALALWATARLGSGPREVFFGAQSMSDVVGVVLDDGRKVALKRRGGGEHVAATAVAHRAASDAGIDCPDLLAGPENVDGQIFTAEQWRDDGSTEPQGDAAMLYAQLLARLVKALDGVDQSRLSPPPWLHYDHDADRVWPPPASDRWDPHRIESQLPPALARIAAAARSRLLAAHLPHVVGHTDLSGLNVRWNHADGVDVPIVHDWDSIAARPEAVLVGTLAADHVALPERGRIADIDTGARVVEAYEEASGRAFSAEEHEVAWAASAWLAAYNAVFEHLHGAPGEVTAQLLRDGDERLRLAGGA
ncbi:phosphotransferase [Demequina zhanjiangensis]|uniref:Phosphotransferase n=1 Tax=Demequina zhanjiangensis TaxID=3051659 RepID=A0ABT8G3L9_9MICO|nr:phosphotransferase [Demequina sp. SYSU T00b26]MDN4473735.1 phosphotransferase [Demequina sp. SYSU T00b26]